MAAGRQALGHRLPEDDEAYDIWTKEIGVPPERIIRIGDNKGAPYASDNFWRWPTPAPAALHRNLLRPRPGHLGRPPGSPEEDGDRFIEIWNNVFMQFNRRRHGDALPAAPCVDTGMGLERLAACCSTCTATTRSTCSRR
jgi:alanyl-tRNA synthetase